MTFFYDLNKRLAGVANKQEPQQLSESAVAERATGDYSAKKAAAGKDIGKPGKAFAKIAKSAGEKYGSKERGEKVAGAVLAKLRKTNEADVEEGNRFTGNLAKARAAGAKQADLDGDGDMEKVREGEVPAQFQKAKKVDIPAYQRKAQGGDWKVTQKDLDKDRERNISDKKGLARLRGVDPDNVDEGWDDMLKMVKDREDMRTGEKRKTSKGEIEKTATGIRHTRSYDADTGETNTGDDTPAGEKRGRGRPKKYTDDKPRQERVTAKSRKADRTAYTKKKVSEYGDFGPMEDQDTLVDRGEYDREGDMAKEQLHTIDSAAKELHAILSDDENLPEWVQSKITKAMDYIDTARDYMKSSKADADEPIAEKAVSQAQQQAAGIALAAKRSGKKPAGKGAAAEMAKMPEKELEKFAKTKHKGLPEKKAKKKEEEVEENTVAGNVAPAASAPKGKGTGGFTFGKGIYDSMNRELESMISESMNISMNMSNDANGGPTHSLTVTATDDDAVKLAALLKMAGVGGAGAEQGPEACPTCSQAPCGCAEQVDENQPDWPTEPEQAEDNFEYSGGLNGPKSTGQTTVPVIAGQDERMGVDGDDELRRIREMAGIKEAKKPDFLDVDKDGDKKEAFKKAVKDKEEKKVEESIFALTNSWKEYKG
jgi:hypothetical protein